MTETTGREKHVSGVHGSSGLEWAICHQAGRQAWHMIRLRVCGYHSVGSLAGMAAAESLYFETTIRKGDREELGIVWVLTSKSTHKWHIYFNKGTPHNHCQTAAPLGMKHSDLNLLDHSHSDHHSHCRRLFLSLFPFFVSSLLFPLSFYIEQIFMSPL